MAKAKIGRPSKFTPELAELICERLANGESLRAICRDDAMPGMAAVFRWIAQDPIFQEQYVRAREAQADHMAEEILEIADDARRDTLITEFGEKPDTEWIARSRLRVDARKWLASKMAPKKYGDFTKQVISGPNDGPIQHEHKLAEEMTDAELADIIATSGIGTSRT